eukprot:gene15257-18044_t
MDELLVFRVFVYASVSHHVEAFTDDSELVDEPLKNCPFFDHLARRVHVLQQKLSHFDKDLALLQVAAGHAIAVLGSAPQLGKGEVAKALKLAWQPGDIWEGTFELPCGVHTSYRLIQVSNDGATQSKDAAQSPEFLITPPIQPPSVMEGAVEVLAVHTWTVRVSLVLSVTPALSVDPPPDVAGAPMSSETPPALPRGSSDTSAAPSDDSQRPLVKDAGAPVDTEQRVEATAEVPEEPAAGPQPETLLDGSDVQRAEEAPEAAAGSTSPTAVDTVLSNARSRRDGDDSPLSENLNDGLPADVAQPDLAPSEDDAKGEVVELDAEVVGNAETESPSSSADLKPVSEPEPPAPNVVILMECGVLETRVAVLEDMKLVQLLQESNYAGENAGSIYLGVLELLGDASKKS